MTSFGRWNRKIPGLLPNRGLGGGCAWAAHRTTYRVSPDSRAPAGKEGNVNLYDEDGIDGPFIRAMGKLEKHGTPVTAEDIFRFGRDRNRAIADLEQEQTLEDPEWDRVVEEASCREK